MRRTLFYLREILLGALALVLIVFLVTGFFWMPTMPYLLLWVVILLGAIFVRLGRVARRS